MLIRVYPLYKKTDNLVINKLAFDLYDYKKDGKLTIDEVYDMFESLPVGSDVYKESHK
jgi:Ca2+-binding EF-hand superfamily protein